MKTFLLACLLLCGCASLHEDQHAQALSDNRLDDGYCVDHGLRYPEPGYVQCRRQLVDRRIYRDWQNLRILHQAGQPVMGAATVTEFHHPDPAGFHCHAEPQFGNDYVFCGYDDASGARHQ